MKKEELLFYSAYEEFYRMASNSRVFQKFCKEAFGEDFSQDGFSNLKQVDEILKYIPTDKDIHVLDIGCGNGKMLGYVREKTGAHIHGFDYSEQAIKTARELYSQNSDFQVGIIGEIEYPTEQFDVIISMDTMYFASDMTAFIAQIKTWLKRDGILFVGYQEGDVVPKTKDAHTTLLAKALKANQMLYRVEDITKQTYELLVKKREAARRHKEAFRLEGIINWYDLLISQTDCITDGFHKFKEDMARYFYVVKK